MRTIVKVSASFFCKRLKFSFCQLRSGNIQNMSSFFDRNTKRHILTFDSPKVSVTWFKAVISDKDKFFRVFTVPFSSVPFWYENNMHSTTVTQQRYSIVQLISSELQPQMQYSWWNNTIPLLGCPPPQKKWRVSNTTKQSTKKLLKCYKNRKIVATFYICATIQAHSLIFENSFKTFPLLKIPCVQSI